MVIFFNMAKGKKQRKDASDDDEPDLLESGEELEAEMEPQQAVNNKKGKKDRKKKKELELEEAQKEIEELEEMAKKETKKKVKKKSSKSYESDSKSEVSEDKSDDDEPLTKKESKKGKKKNKMASDEAESGGPIKQKSGFALLMAGDNDLDDDDNDDSTGGNVTDESSMAQVEEEKKAKKDKKKKKKKGGAASVDKEQDELDRALAELQIENPNADDEKKKKKEKKERQKMKQFNKETEPQAIVVKEQTPVQEDGQDLESEDVKGKKGKKKGDKKEDDKKGKKPGKGTLLAMQEALKKVQEEQDKAKREEEERIQREEDAEKERLEKKRIDEEKKALKKQRDKERKEQLRKEGKLLTAKQKEQKARAEQMLAAMRAQGLEVPETGVKKGPRPGTRIRGKNKAKSQTPEGDEGVKKEEEVVKEEPKEETKTEDEPKEETKEEEDDVKDSWELVLEEKEEESKEEEKESTSVDEEDENSEADEEEDTDSDDEAEESDEEEDDHNEVQKRKERAVERIAKRKAEYEVQRNTDILRAPVVVVMGHVDTGKTKILDKLRRTNVQDGEAGGITQQIGATNVPIDVIYEQCKMVNGFDKATTKLPGLLIIDTPGHESFSNLRDRGSSLCDIAILVVDIMHSLEPQTIESINLLKKKKVPFVIALNKIDRLYEWKSNRHKDIEEVIKGQPANTRIEFDKRAREVITGMAEQGLNAALFYDNPDPKTYISMVPTSAHSGDGMGNLMGLLVKLSQTMLAKRLSFSQELQATVLEVKAISGLGTTIDIILINGYLREGQTMILAGTDGPIVTQIKALLTPSKMQDLRVKNTYVEHKEIQAAQGVKIAAKELEKTVAGMNLLVANHPDEVEICKEEMTKRLAQALNSIKVKDRGVYVQASTLGSLEALVEFLRTSKIPYAGVKIGPVVKRDVMKASAMLEHEEKYTVILAFDVKVERDAQELADSLGVKIFKADIIYHLCESFTQYQEDLKRQKRDQFKHVAVFPCKLRIMPNFVFNSRDPIVAGVIVEAGLVKPGTPICVPSKGNLDIGIVSGIEANHKETDVARKGDEVCIKIDPIPGESPKMFGRHFDETDILVSKISRASIDACKDYFRDDLQKSDWQLMVELKKLFQIL